jgi:hypothetical protein
MFEKIRGIIVDYTVYIHGSHLGTRRGLQDQPLPGRG